MLGLGEPEPKDFDIYVGLAWKSPPLSPHPLSPQAQSGTTPHGKPPAKSAIVHAPEPKRLETPKKAATPKSQGIGQAIEELLATSALHNGNGQLGVYVVNLENNTVLFERNVHRDMVPASNMKLFTTAAALEFLSPDFAYETVIETQGEITPNGVTGDVVVRGSGDPTISARMHDWDPLAVFKKWARQLRAMGVTTIHGDLIGDASLFERFVYCPGWDPDDEPIWYAAQTDALSLNENCIKVFVRPGKRPGMPVRVELEPETSHVQVQNTGRTGSRRSSNTLRVTRRCGTNVIEISGQLPTRFRERVRTLTIDDPANYFMEVLGRTLKAGGITVNGRIFVSRRPGAIPRGRVLLRETSPPLSKLIEETNTESNNFFAEQLLRTLGAYMRGHGSRENGAAVVSEWLQGMGVPKKEFNMVDGSGLSRHNRITPNAVVTLLRHMHDSPNRAIYLHSLPISGKAGTLRRRMRGTPAYAQVMAKTGYMKGVTSLGGYTESLDGKPLAFSVIYNGRRPSTSYVKSLEDKLCILLRTHEVGVAAKPEPGTSPVTDAPQKPRPTSPHTSLPELAPAA